MALERLEALSAEVRRLTSEVRAQGELLDHVRLLTDSLEPTADPRTMDAREAPGPVEPELRGRGVDVLVGTAMPAGVLTANNASSEAAEARSFHPQGVQANGSCDRWSSWQSPTPVRGA